MRRWRTAMARASSVRCWSGLALMAHPITRREYRSRSTATYEPTRLRRHRRDIAHPDPIEGGRHKALLQHIGRGRRQLMPFHADAEPADAPCFQAREFSEACHAMPPTRHPGLRQGLP